MRKRKKKQPRHWHDSFVRCAKPCLHFYSSWNSWPRITKHWFDCFRVVLLFVFAFSFVLSLIRLEQSVKEYLFREKWTQKEKKERCWSKCHVCETNYRHFGALFLISMRLFCFFSLLIGLVCSACIENVILFALSLFFPLTSNEIDKFLHLKTHCYILLHDALRLILFKTCTSVHIFHWHKKNIIFFFFEWSFVWARACTQMRRTSAINHKSKNERLYCTWK